MQDNPVLEIKNLRTYFYTNNRCNKAVDGVSFQLHRGKTRCIVGESGCGKSVTALSIMQLLPELSRIESGQILYYKGAQAIHLEGLPRNGKAMRRLRGGDISMIFQDPMTALNPVYSVGFQIMENLQYHTAMNKKARKEKVLELFRQMGIPEQRFVEYPHQFSGGMRQRVMIAMAMSCQPKLLLADEPTTALDVTVQAQIFDLMLRLQQAHHTAVMMITHDMGAVAELADDVTVMYMGMVVEEGSVCQVLQDPAHPYTRGLLGSAPVLGRGKNQSIQPIRGQTPAPFHRTKGCPFASRCDWKTALCEDSRPPEDTVAAGHRVRCFHYKESQ